MITSRISVQLGVLIGVIAVSAGLVPWAGLWSVRQISSEIDKVQKISMSLANQSVIEGMSVAILRDVILGDEDADKARLIDNFNVHARNLIRASQQSHFLNLAAGVRVDTKQLETRAKAMVGEARAIVGGKPNNSQNSNSSYSRLFDRANALSAALEPISAELLQVSRKADERATGASILVERIHTGLGGFSVLVAGFSIWFMAYRIAKPVSELVGFVDGSSNGDTQPINFQLIERNDEIGVLARAIDNFRGLSTSLRESEERFQLAVRGTDEGIWDWQVAEDKLVQSPRAHELMGYGTDDPRIESMAMLLPMLHPEESSRVQAVMRAHLKHHTPYNIVHRMRCKDGSYRWFRARAQAVWDANGLATRMVGSLADIDDQVQSHEKVEAATKELKCNKELLESILVMSPESIIIADKHLNITSFSRGAQHVFGHEPGDMIGKSVETLIPGRLHLKHRDHAEAFTNGTATTTWTSGRGSVAALRKNGEEFRANISISKNSSANGPVYAVTLRDLSKDLAERQVLENAKIAADTANKLKSQFLANMSHEIRTPMNGVMGMAQLLLKTPLDDKQTRFADMLLSSSRALLSIINDILDLSKIESGMMTLTIDSIDMKSMVQEAMDRVEGVAVQKELKLSHTVAQVRNGTFEGDSPRIIQMMVNFLGNAIKFTEQGEVTLEVGPGTGGTTRFAVRDTGPGIPADQLSIIFERFRQVDGTSTRKHGGTGLGLAITKELVALMKGTMGVESTVGKGSSFWVELPLTFEKIAAAKADAAVDESPEHLMRGLRVLVAEDIEANQVLIREILEMFGMTSRIVGTGQLALNALKEENYDLVLMDIHMPEMNGDIAIQHIRTSGKSYADIPIIVVTAEAMKGMEEHYLGIGADGYVPKPIEIALLTATIKSIFDKKSERAAA